MNIPKAHSMTLLEFVGHFLDDGFEPYNDLEKSVVRRVLGFANFYEAADDDLFHLAQDKGVYDIGYHAKVYLTDEHASAILDMATEAKHDLGSTRRYLEKNFGHSS